MLCRLVVPHQNRSLKVKINMSKFISVLEQEMDVLINHLAHHSQNSSPGVLPPDTNLCSG